MSAIAEDSAFVEMMAAGFERCGTEVFAIRTDYWKLCEIADDHAASAEGVGTGTTRLRLSDARALIATARKRIVARIAKKLEA